MFKPEISRYDLSGYIPDGVPVIQTYSEKQYSIQKYQKPHHQEYLVVELQNGIPNGLTQLFNKGVLQLSWRMNNGNREGCLTIYEDGIVSRVVTWENLYKSVDSGKIYEVVNDMSGFVFMVERLVETGVIVYKGGYNNNTMEREGYGVEYDEESGVEKLVGYYHKNMLVHIYQSFEKDKNGMLVMTEFYGDERVDNVDNVLNLATVYVGGYRFDEKTNKYVRSGKGKEIDKYSGICDRVVERDENGVELEGGERRLFGGWYGEGESDYSIRMSQLKRVQEEEDIKRQEEQRYWNERLIACSGLYLSYPRGIEEIVIEGNHMNEECNDSTLEMKLDLSMFKRLKRVNIYPFCFKNVREFVLDGLQELESVNIGNDCFRISKGEDDVRYEGVCRITNCPKLHQLVFGNGSFGDFNQFKLSNVNSLQSIQFGSGCFLYTAKCILKGE